MKSLIEQQKYTKLILVILLVVIGIQGTSLADITPVSDRTPQVRDAIVAAINGVDSADDVTAEHLAAITYLYLWNRNITSLKVGDFDGLTALTYLSLSDNAFTSLPSSIFDGLTALTTLDLRRNDLTSLPSGIFDGLTALTRLELNSNAFTSLPSGIFDELTALTSLSLRVNDLTSLPSGIFDELTALTYLSLDDNDLTSLPSGIFDELTALTYLSLDDNDLTSLPSGIFDELTALTRLHLHDNSISDIYELEDLTSLNYLLLFNNPISDYGPLRNLKTTIEAAGSRIYFDIDINNNLPVFSDGDSTTRSIAENTASGQNIGTAVSATDADNHTLTYTLGGTDAESFSIVSTSGQLQTSAALDYETKSSYEVTVTVYDGNSGGDKITVTINVPYFTPVNERTQQVQDAIVAVIDGVDSANDVTAAHLAAINGLYLQSKSITSLKVGDFDGLTALTYLSLNDFTSLPSGIFDGLTALTRLELSDNAFTSLPSGIFDGLTALTRLELSDNAFTSLPSGIFDGLTALTYLELRFSLNAFTSLPSGIFDGLTALTYLYLDDNAFTSLPSGIFDELTALTTLDLRRNDLTSLPSGIFDELTALTSLSLHGNDFTSLPSGIFDELTALGGLNLSDNAFTSLPSGIFDELTALGTLHLDDNYISDVSELEDLTSLTYLSLHGNSISDISALENLTSLIVLLISGNPISDYGPLRNLKTTISYIDIDINNNPPMFSDGDSTTRSISENTASGQNIGTAVSATDADNHTLTYTLGGTDAESFSIVSTSGQLQTSAALDYETKSSYEVTVTVYDGNSGGDKITVTINVTVNNAPVFTDGTSTTRSIAENTASGQNIGDAVAATDADTDDTLTYSLGGTDASSFSIVSTSGQLQTSAALDYEIKSSYEVTVTVYDGNSGGDKITVTINVTAAVNERTQQVQDAIVAAVPGVDSADDVTAVHLAAITALSLDEKSISSLKTEDFSGLTSLKSLSLESNSISDISALANLTSLRWLYLGGNSISDISALANLTSLEWLSLGGNSISDISALANLTSLEWLSLRYNSISDISALANLTALIRLDLQNNSISNISALENLTVLRHINLSVNYSISDISVLKNLTSLRTLELGRNSISDVSALEGLISLDDLELKNNLIADYVPLHRLKAANPDVNIDIDINNSPPVFSEGASTTRSIAENTSSWRNIGAPVTATDTDNDTQAYFLRGTDAALFHVGLITGQLQNRVSFDYETKNSYSVTIVVRDGNGGGNSIDVTINVTDVPETNSVPTFTDGTNTTRTIAENTTSGQQNIGNPIAATDADSGDTLTYTLGGTDASSFSIVSTSGQLQTKAALDYETNAFYVVTVTVSDGYGGSDSITVTIIVTDVHEIPIIPVSERTQQVQDAIVAAIEGVDSADDVTAAHLAAITTLSLKNKSITSLKAGDFDGLTALTWLSLRNNSISDISALEDLTELTTLILTLNSISDISALEDLTKLTRLDLGYNSISDISTLENLTELTSLSLPQNYSISDISTLENLTKLTGLSLNTNSISDISALEDLTELTYLTLYYNSISDISALEDLTKLIDLSLHNNSISDISALEDLTELTYLTLDYNSISDISVLEDLTKLTSLGLSYNSISDISELEDLTLLTKLRISGNPISDYGPLRNLKTTIEAAGSSISIDIDIDNNLPVFSDGNSTTRSVAENTASGQNIGTAVAATDEDNDTLTYTLSGTDAAVFSIVSTSGQLQTKAALDYETETSYFVTVTVSDGNGGSDSITVTINVTDVHEIPIVPVSDRTPEVRDAIVASVPNVSDAANVTAAHVAAITSLNLRNAGITTLEADDFSGMTALTSINLFNNQLSSLPDGIFEGLTSLTTVRLGKNAVDPLPFTVSLEKVADGQFKAVAPAGALFNIVLPITVTDGSVTGSATTVTIPHGNVESDTLKVTRTAGTTADVTVDIGTLPSLPRTHFGYALVKSDVLPLPVIMGINTAPVFTDGGSTTRSIAENTDTGEHIGTAVAATDAENDTLTYTLSGNDASAFNIDDTTGQLKIKSALDYETKSSYTVTITVSDGTFTETIKVTINVTDIDEVVTPPVTPDPPTANVAPEFLEGDSGTRFVLENTAAGEDIGKAFFATDANSDWLGYTLGGIDADSFELGSSGQLKTKAALDYETKRVYSVTITVADEELSNTITVIISVIDVNDTVISAGFVPVADRTPEVRDAIVTAVPNVTDAVNVTESQVAAITNLNLRGKGISSLKTGDFSGMTALTNLNLFKNNLSSLPPGLFTGLTALTTLRLGSNAVDPMPLIVSLQQVNDGQFKAVIPTGAPFNIVLPISVSSSIIGGATTSTTIPIGSMESRTFTVSGTSVKAAFGTLPSLPENHFGYTLALSNVCNRTKAVAEAIANAVGASECSAVTEVDLATITTLSLSNQSIASLAAGDFDGMFSLKTLYLINNDLTSLPSGIFDDLVSLGTLSLVDNKLTTLPSGVFSNLTSLTNLNLSGNDFSSLPSDAFEGLSSLSSISLQDIGLTSLPGSIFDGMSYLRSILLSNNNFTSIPNGIFEGLTRLIQLHLSWNPTPNSEMSLTVTLQKVGTNQFKAVAPSGAPFEMTLPIKVTNGILAGGANAIIISKGSVESSPITVTRTPGTVTAVTADFGTPLPTLPDLHYGYVLVKSATLPLEVLPPLNLPPVFKDGANTVRAIAENSAAGTNIGDAVTATDQDANDTLTYTLGGTDAASFIIDNTTGQIKTKAALDYETKNSYIVTLTVSDGLATDTIVVTINITDIDENRAPVFTEGSSTTRTVVENTATGEHIGTSVGATDADNDTLTYSLSGTDASAFGIDTSTGQLKTSASLDYETKRIYSVTITVSDDKLTDTIVVTINVTDVEEVETPPEEVDEVPSNNAPVFTDGSSTTRNVSEDAAIGVDIGAAVAATDADGHTLTYILGGTDAATFSIDSTTGQLRTNTALDYETKSSYTVTITASDDTDEATIAVTINVVDATENSAPVFPVFIAGVSVSRSVPENTGSGVDIGTPIAANDVDGDTLTYTLSGPDASSFGIDSTTGQLRTDAFLDYETKSTYSVTITASDGTLTDSISVSISVTDVDETPTNSEPVFDEGSSTSRSIDENTGSGVDIGSAVSATDADGDTLSYNLSGTDASAFSIDSSSGQIRTSASLDYETQSSYTLTVNVSDGNGGSDSIAVTINISNVNEAPVFTNGTSTTRSIAENAPADTNIGAAVAATDPDDDELTYSLGGTDTASFSVDSATGSLKTNAVLDFETKSTYSVTLTVSDGTFTDTITVTINVTDLDETPSNVAPVFTEGDTATRSVAENTNSGVNIGTPVAATDTDSTTLAYLLSGTDAAAFSIVSDTGQLQTSASLDFETKSTYTIIITVNDGSQTDEITVTINVTNVNEAPTFTAGASTTRSVAENTVSGTNIGAVITATDPDANTTLAYTLGGTDASSFSIVSTSGQLQTSAALDYETKTSYSVTITVSDGSLRDTITVTINVTDVDENRAPSFTDGTSATLSVAENTGSGQNISTAVSATDPDNDTLTYTLSGTDAASFSIVSTSGQLRTKAALDYETKTSYSVKITVSDSKLTDSIDVTINVTDVQENRAPSFSDGSSTTRSVAENTASGQDIGTAVAATDPDSDTLTYTLSGTDASSFSINGTTGQLRTSGSLNYESKTSYSVTVSVSDGNGESDSISVTINITNVNEAPSFTDGSTTTRSIAENTASDTNIGSAVSATDVDSGTTLTYTLSGTDAASFSIVSTSGQLQTSAALDYETKSSYSVTITVSDGTLTDSITVTINVTDVAENSAPAFSAGTSISNISATAGTAITSVTLPAATDADADTITYTLTPALPAGLTFTASTRVLSGTPTTATASATYTYKASDGTDSASLTFTIVVNAAPTNNAPAFTDGTSTSRSVAENTAANTNIGSAVAATDADNDTLTYTLGGTDASSFSIVSTSGQLQTSAALDYETKTSYSVTVSVSDGNSGSESITVTINVTDVDESYPLTGRTQEVQDAIVAAIKGVDSADDVSAAHLAAINGLYLQSKSITSLKAGDFDGLTALTSLYLYSNSISDISALEDLTKLTSLYLYSNSISDISALEDMTKLTYLELGRNSISDISALEDMTALTTLKLYFNSISDISALEDLTKLTELNLGSNSISDISVLEDMTKLTRLYLYSNSISDISVLEDMTKLTRLNLSDNSISDISALEDMTKLTWLNLYSNSISDISALEDMTKLTTLKLSDNSISDISALEDMTKLTWLELGSNSISDISALEDMTKLTWLILRGNPISDYGPLRNLKTTIEAAGSGIYIDINLDNNPPVFSDGDSTTRSIAENTASGQNIGDAVAATDADTDDTLTYTLSGTDAESFSIVSTSGQLQTSAALDYETKSSYTVTVDVSDGNDGLDRITVTINVTDVEGAAPSVETSPIIPENTALFTNFPNPFNPETWIPYQLAKPADVTLTIYNMQGVVVRALRLGHKPAGVYTSRSRAIHWDGRNSIGEKVATGVYFYTLKAGDWTATRKMLIRK